MSGSEQTFLTNEELAARLRVDDNTPPKWRIKGEGPRFVRFGRLIRYPLAEVIAWEQSRIRRSTSDRGKAA